MKRIFIRSITRKRAGRRYKLQLAIKFVRKQRYPKEDYDIIEEEYEVNNQKLQDRKDKQEDLKEIFRNISNDQELSELMCEFNCKNKDCQEVVRLLKMIMKK